MVILYMLFITYYRKQKIISDNGYLKMMLFSIGIAFYFISNYFVTYSDYCGCSLNFIFKHIGISLPLVILYINVMLGSGLGMKNDNKFQFISDANLDNDCISNQNNNTLNNFADKCSIQYNNNNNNNNNNKNNNLLDNSKKSISDRIAYMPINDEISNKIRSVKSQFITIVLLYFVFVMIIFTIVFYTYNENDKDKSNLIVDVQDRNGNFIYGCKLENFDLTLYLLCFYIYVIIIIKVRRILMYNYIFICIKYIIYISIYGIVFGPVVNVIN